MLLVQQKLRRFNIMNNILHIERSSLFIDVTCSGDEGNGTWEWCWHRCGQHPFGCLMGQDSVRVKSDSYSLFWRDSRKKRSRWYGEVALWSSAFWPYEKNWHLHTEF